MNSPKEIAQNYIAVGAAKTKTPIAKLFVLGILAGMFIALAGVACTVSSATLSGSVAKLIGAMVFPGGLAMVLIAGSELFTGNNLIIMSVLDKQATIGGMLKNWVVVYIGNFAGSILIAALIFFGGTINLFSGDVGVAAINTAAAKVSMTFGTAFVRGILCNFLVCIAVWMALAAKDVTGKIVGLFFPIMFFVLCGYEHSVANMYFISAGLFASTNAQMAAAVDPSVLQNLSWGSFFSANLLPVTLGNIIGGSGLAGVVYWFLYLGGKKDKVNAVKK